jgi:ribonuclease BN (tRNA processing enzyme)
LKLKERESFMVEIIILGSGCGFAVQNRYNPSTALLVKDRCYLLDCGEPAAGLLFQNGIDPLSVRAIFVSHLHADHIGGLAQVLFSMYLPGRSSKKKFKEWSITRYDDWYRSSLRFPESFPEEGVESKVSICIPLEGITGISAYLDAVYLSPDLLPFDLDISPVELGRFYRDDQVSVSAISNLHLKNNFRYRNIKDKHPEKELQSYSFMVEVEGTKIVYSGDIDNLTELVPFMDNADVLMVEIAHYDPRGIKEFIDQYSLKRVILYHIHPGLEARISRLVRDWGDPRICVAVDGTSFQI